MLKDCDWGRSWAVFLAMRRYTMLAFDFQLLFVSLHEKWTLA